MAGVMGKRIGILVAVLLGMAHPADLNSCGPFITQAFFNRNQVPVDARSFYRGHLGILQPSYQRRFLAVAYRTLQECR